MTPGSRIQEQEHLSQYAQVSTLVYHLLSIAIAGGLPEHEAGKMYDKILGSYSNIDGEAFWLMRDEIISILVASDDQIKVEENRPHRWN